MSEIKLKHISEEAYVSIMTKADDPEWWEEGNTPTKFERHAANLALELRDHLAALKAKDAEIDRLKSDYQHDVAVAEGDVFDKIREIAKLREALAVWVVTSEIINGINVNYCRRCKATSNPHHRLIHAPSCLLHVAKETDHA